LREELPRLHSEVADAADRIRRIVDDMKTFTRLGPDHTRQLLNLNEIAESAIRLSHNALKNATDRFQTEFAHELLEVTVNRQQIEQVIVNLLINASQALTTRNEAIILRTGRDKPGKVWLAVIDEGRGISSENLSHVTDPFFTTRRERGGTGLGLSISARIVHDHHGELNITSIGRGTTVKIILPASDRKDQP
jgi:polar amino acid transport system substrate-binding protein